MAPPPTTTSPASVERVDGFLPIEGYAALGDGRSLALVGLDGSIDWMCAPELDSPSLFAALLDPPSGGSFSLAPAEPYAAKRRYLPHTNVLETEYETDAGTVRVTEAMTVDPDQDAPWRELVRHVEGVSGTVAMRWRLRLRVTGDESGQAEPARQAGMLIWRHERIQVGLRCWDAGDPEIDSQATSGEFRIEQGASAMLALVASDSVALPDPARGEVARRLEATTGHWQRWISRTRYDGPWREQVQRSLLAIRLLTDARTGAIAAAGTTSLPEAVGGQRNYDYRFAWVRDLSFTIEALLRVGMGELAHSSTAWLLDAVTRTHPRIDPVYTLTGEVVRSQRAASAPGYRGSNPVLIGNQAGTQLQLGGFGDLLEAVWRYADSGYLLAADVGERLADRADLLCAIWQNADAGLWELGDTEQYTTSKLGCWTALERILQLVQAGQVPPRHVERWERERDRIRTFIETELWSQERQSYVMKAGSEDLDCGVLLAARRDFCEPGSERMSSTIDAIREELQAEGPLLYRYSGMREQENAFVACSFWMVEALALNGRREEAREMMDSMVPMANDVGLLSEEITTGEHSLRGNFPQALSHLALISAAAILGDVSSDADS